MIHLMRGEATLPPVLPLSFDPRIQAGAKPFADFVAGIIGLEASALAGEQTFSLDESSETVKVNVCDVNFWTAYGRLGEMQGIRIERNGANLGVLAARAVLDSELLCTTLYFKSPKSPEKGCLWRAYGVGSIQKRGISTKNPEFYEAATTVRRIMEFEQAQIGNIPIHS